MTRATREKITCSEVRRVRGLSKVFTHSVANKGIAIACRRYTLTIFDLSPHLERETPWTEVVG